VFCTEKNADVLFVLSCTEVGYQLALQQCVDAEQELATATEYKVG
jgi:hypothetical protein